MIVRPAICAAGLLAATLIPAPAVARTVVAHPIAVADIVAGVETCRAAAVPGGFDTAKLAAAGYGEGKLIDKSGKLAKADQWGWVNAADIALVLDKKAHSCAVIAQIATSADWVALNTEVNRKLGTQPSTTVMGKTVWTLPAGSVELQAVGSREIPGVRATITSVSQESK